MFSLFGKRREKNDATTTATTTAAAVETPPAPPAPAAEPASASASAAAADEAPATHGLNVDALLARPAPTPAEPANAQPAVGPADPVQTDALKPAIVEAIGTVFDPEIPVNIYELGLIYEIIVDTDRRVGVRMTLTSPACPSAQQLPSEVRYKVKAVEGVTDCTVDVVWEPPWTKEMMSEAAKLSLGLF
jgi:FeS assembly SUF system protein